MGDQSQNDHSDSNQYTIDEIISITKSFTNPISKGRFATVCHGNLQDGTQAAVKLLSKSSTQGVKEFQAEESCFT